MSHLTAYYAHLLERGLSQDEAVDRLAVMQNGFASAASRRAFFAKLGSAKRKSGGRETGKGAKTKFDKLTRDQKVKPTELSAAARDLTARARAEGTPKAHREAAEAHRMVQEFVGSAGWPSRGLSKHALEEHKELELRHTREAESLESLRATGMTWLKRAPIPQPAGV